MDSPQCTSIIYSVPAVPSTTSETSRLNLNCLCCAQTMASVLFVIAEHCYENDGLTPVYLHNIFSTIIYSVPAVPSTTSETSRLNLNCLCCAQTMASVLFVIAEHCYVLICLLVCENSCRLPRIF